MEKTNPSLFYSEGEMPEGPGLKGMRCGACGHVVQPSGVLCPMCDARDLHPISIGRDATLIQHSVVHHDADMFKAPYIIGLVRLEEGPTPFVPILNNGSEPLQNGTAMYFRLVPMPDGERIGFTYAPRNRA
jgi:uncharacterized OB-fold protein